MERIRRFWDTWKMAFPLLLVAVAGGYAIQQAEHATDLRLHKSQIAACERGNLARSEMNLRIGEFAKTIATWRILIAHEQTTTPRLADQLATALDDARFQPLPIVHCSEAIKSP